MQKMPCFSFFSTGALSV